MTAHPFRLITLAASLTLLGGAFAAQAQSPSGADTLRLLAPAARDQIVSRLRAPAPGKLDTSGLERAPIAVSWALDAAKPLDAHPQAFVRESREYWIDASETELQRGVALDLSARGAVIRISPHASNLQPLIERRDIVLRAGGQQLHLDGTVQALASEDDLRAAGMDAPAGSVALRLADGFAANRIELAVPTARGAWLVHVYEPASKVVLKLGAERERGNLDAIRVQAEFAGVQAPAGISGLISAPDGHTQELAFTRQPDGRFVASVVPDLAHAGDRGLWEVHAFAQAGASSGGVPRDARTAFAVNLPVARLDGRVERIASKARGPQLDLRIGVEALVASRYQVAAVLYGTAADGRLRPAAVAQSAAWLERGHGLIDLRYDAASLAGTTLGPPWEVRDLRLLNQADMGLLERRERALALPR